MKLIRMSKQKQKEFIAEIDSIRTDMRLGSMYMSILEKSRKGLLPEIELPEVPHANKRSNRGR